MHRLLLVDDEHGILNSLERVLGRDGYEVNSFTSGPAALKAAEKHPYHIVISDYRMPEMDGIAFLKKIKELQPDAVRVILTGHADVEAVMEAINTCEVYRFLSKPWNDQELKLTVRQALQHQELLLENRRLAEEVRRQRLTLERLEQLYPGIAAIRQTDDGRILIEE